MSTRVLQSWKQISAYVGRTDRTLQRWERKFGFPVHRPSGKSRSAVVAVVSEIEKWMRATPLLGDAREAAKLRPAGTPLPTAGLNAEKQPIQPQRIDFHTRKPFLVTRAVTASSLNGDNLGLLGNLAFQRKLRAEQRILLEQLRSLRREHRNARLAVARQLDKLGG